MAVVYLVRHGQASFGAADYDVLSPMGERQSVVAGEELRRRAVTASVAYTGALKRQRETARLALSAAGLEVPLVEDERWNEYDHVGLTDQHLRNAAPSTPRGFQQLLDDALHAWIMDGGDVATTGSFAEFVARGSAALDDVIGSLGSGAAALVFTSGGVISSICTRLLGLPPQGFLAVNRVVANASITKLVHGRSGTSLLSFNEHGHFEGPAKELLTYR